jgi:hypothetical protein
LGGEYEKLNTFFQKVGITHHVFCPHAYQQNSSAERKYRHIVEVGLALLAHASMPLKFWDGAFLTATYLINLLPTKVLNHMSPMEKLLHVKPNYESLRVFGCACWPNLRPYNKRNLSFRSKRRVFLGYGPHKKGVKCIDISSGRVYISRDVVFEKNIFSFALLHPNDAVSVRKFFFYLTKLHPFHPIMRGCTLMMITCLLFLLLLIPHRSQCMRRQLIQIQKISANNIQQILKKVLKQMKNWVHLAD